MSDRVPLSDVAAYARRVEALGYDTLHVPETVHDGLMVSLLALQATTRLRVTSSVILAFVRSPMLVAYTAWDLAQVGEGRFELGLGAGWVAVPGLRLGASVQGVYRSTSSNVALEIGRAHV